MTVAVVIQIFLNANSIVLTVNNQVHQKLSKLYKLYFLKTTNKVWECRIGRIQCIFCNDIKNITLTKILMKLGF